MLTNALQEFLDRSGFSEGPPRVSASVGREHLCHLFHAMGFICGAEIGVWEGEFSEQICRAVPGVQLTCVDPWQWYRGYRDPKNDQHRLEVAYRAACDRLAPFGCAIQRMTSLEAAAQVPNGSLDFVYLDGNHAFDYVVADLNAWSPKVRSGGMVSGHDFSTRKVHIQVVPAVGQFTKERGIADFYVVAKEKKSPSFFWLVP